jgi:hypothetical protein
VVGRTIVDDLRMLKGPGSHPAEFNVSGYDRDGNMPLRTWHIGEPSMQMSRGEVERKSVAEQRLTVPHIGIDYGMDNGSRPALIGVDWSEPVEDEGDRIMRITREIAVGF